MKAITLRKFGGPEMMQLSEVETPAPAEDQVLIKVSNSSVNRPDVIQRQGNYPPPPGDSEILGLEVAGVIESSGENTSRFKPGERVVALVGGGGYAEYALAREDHCMSIPESVSFEQAACICETYITAYLNLFMLGELQGRQSVLIHGGGGGVATAAIQLCKALSPETRIFVTASSAKLERVSAQGADHVIDYREQSFADEIKRLTEGRGVDVILDHIGAKYLESNMKSLALAGTLMLIGVMGGIKAELNLATMMVKRQRIIGSVLRSRPVAEKASIIHQFETEVMPLFAAGTIEPVIDARFALKDAADAHRLMEQGGHFGKIILSNQD
ncbi:MAG: NAD(P)H-quinone oxidoreductase [Gammaproteobacteria bacterium]|nr:NAD(P)H-quinone oxidoreductase [Gammaproteobacteria bacterium]MDH3856487.1 NAD(P)H-quinone oxidoreductase [Gammaproteobacteria bacterium]